MAPKKTPAKSKPHVAAAGELRPQKISLTVTLEDLEALHGTEAEHTTAAATATTPSARSGQQQRLNNNNNSNDAFSSKRCSHVAEATGGSLLNNNNNNNSNRNGGGTSSSGSNTVGSIVLTLCPSEAPRAVEALVSAVLGAPEKATKGKQSAAAAAAAAAALRTMRFRRLTPLGLQLTDAAALPTLSAVAAAAAAAAAAANNTTTSTSNTNNNSGTIAGGTATATTAAATTAAAAARPLPAGEAESEVGKLPHAPMVVTAARGPGGVIDVGALLIVLTSDAAELAHLDANYVALAVVEDGPSAALVRRLASELLPPAAGPEGIIDVGATPYIVSDMALLGEEAAGGGGSTSAGVGASG